MVNFWKIARLTTIGKILFQNFKPSVLGCFYLACWVKFQRFLVENFFSSCDAVIRINLCLIWNTLKLIDFSNSKEKMQYCVPLRWNLFTFIIISVLIFYFGARVSYLYKSGGCIFYLYEQCIRFTYSEGWFIALVNLIFPPQRNFQRLAACFVRNSAGRMVEGHAKNLTVNSEIKVEARGIYAACVMASNYPIGSVEIDNDCNNFSNHTSAGCKFCCNVRVLVKNISKCKVSYYLKISFFKRSKNLTTYGVAKQKPRASLFSLWRFTPLLQSVKLLSSDFRPIEIG